MLKDFIDRCVVFDQCYFCKYLVLILSAFFLIVYPLFDIDRGVYDIDYRYYSTTSLIQILIDGYQSSGLYRILSSVLNGIIASASLFFPFKSLLLPFFYLISYAYFVDIIGGVIGFHRNKRLLLFVSVVCNPLILSSVYNWTRMQNEVISIFVSLFFVKLVVRYNKNLVASAVILSLWGCVTLLVYELHYPFLVVLLLSFGFVGTKTIVYAFLFSVIPLVALYFHYDSPKIVDGVGGVVYNFINIHEYVNIKMLAVYESLKFDSFSVFVGPLVVVVFLVVFIYCFKGNKFVAGKQVYLSRSVVLVFLSVVGVLLFYLVSSGDSNINGKIHWSIINMLVFNVMVALLYNLTSVNIKVWQVWFVMVMVFISGLSVRNLSLNIMDKKYVEGTVYKNFVPNLYGHNIPSPRKTSSQILN